MNLNSASRELVEQSTATLPGIQARVYSNYVLRSLRDATMKGWTESEAHHTSSEALRLAALGFSLLGEDTALASKALRRAAELLEWLQFEHLPAPLDLLACLLYQIAGYPAISRSMAFRLDADDGIIEAIAKGDITRAEQHLYRLLPFFGSDPSVIKALTSETDRCNELFLCGSLILASHLKWGDRRVQEALEYLRSVADYFLAADDDYSWLLSRAFYHSAERFVKTSLRTVCEPLFPQLSPDGRRALERYLREAYVEGKALAWPSQQKGIAALAAGEDFAICTPTGSGKTTVAELAIIQGLFSHGDNFFAESAFGKLVLYIVPSRALAAEVHHRLGSAFRDDTSFPVQVVSSYGGNDLSASENWLSSQRGTVLICTQEKADALIRSAGPLFLNRLGLVIIDEAHNVNAGRDRVRGLRLESLIARIRNLSAGRSSRFIALSAVLPDPSALGRWTSPFKPDPVNVDYRSTRQAFGRLTLAPDGQFTAEYDMLNGFSLGNEAQYRPRIPDFVPNFTHAGERVGSGPEVQMRAASLWTAAHLAALERPDSGPVLIAVGSNINYYAKDYLKLLTTWTDLPTFFDDAAAARSEAFKIALITCEDYFGRASYEYSLLTLGIVVHHGKLPSRMAHAFTRLIDGRIIRIVLATSTLSQGVNLPFQSVLFPSLRTSKTTMPTEYVRNVIGRAGRPGVAREGRALVLLGTGKIFKNAAKAYREVVDKLSGSIGSDSPASAISQLLRAIAVKWSEMVPNPTRSGFVEWLEGVPLHARFTDRELNEQLDQLDQFAVSAIYELEHIDGFDLTSSEIGARLQELYGQTYAFAVNPKGTAAKDALNGRLRGVLRQIVEQPSVRRSYKSSLGPRSAQTLEGAIPEFSRALNTGFSYLTMSPNERVLFFVELLRSLWNVKEFDVNAGIPHSLDITRLLNWWLQVDSAYPPADKIGDWYKAANESLAYVGTWAIGSAVQFQLDADFSDTEALGERLRLAGLPYITLYLRDMLSLGCQDPIQGYILARGIVTTRSEAMFLAQDYYSQHGSASDDALLPDRVAAWVRTDIHTPSTEKLVSAVTFDVSFVSDLQGISPRRVWPRAEVGTAVIWHDMTGYPIARSDLIEVPKSIAEVHDHDFWLDPIKKTVDVSLYLS